MKPPSAFIYPGAGIGVCIVIIRNFNKPITAICSADTMPKFLQHMPLWPLASVSLAKGATPVRSIKNFSSIAMPPNSMACALVCTPAGMSASNPGWTALIISSWEVFRNSWALSVLPARIRNFTGKGLPAMKRSPICFGNEKMRNGSPGTNRALASHFRFARSSTAAPPGGNPPFAARPAILFSCAARNSVLH